MPMIGGRYYMNPIAGKAIEAARAAEDVLRGAGGVDDESADAGAEAGAGPVHKIEIEATEVVPSHTGRATRGFVARVHRVSAGAPASGLPSRGASGAPQTHVFTDHRDLAQFVGDTLGGDSE